MMLGNGCASSPASRRRRGRPRGGGGSGYGFWQPQSLHHHQQQEISPVVPPCTEFDMAYFRAYSHIGVHEEMLKDRVRTETYRAAIMRYQHLISDKVVLDVGCGTGILAIFCAFAGARRASEVVKENNLSDKVTVLLGRVEALGRLPRCSSEAMRGLSTVLHVQAPLAALARGQAVTPPRI
ncbi:hypothetical protein C4D60_Mb09t18860 [Musa balbisiana]|uniref:Methyltransferase domain-containing protein n=1 Tax=Musa balbisiana TaxID=52838 RepID=A0A4S8IIT1_MUSBA|nr:hypothetical protein C4D60_Mb09t18860 [Musa balbisiana]